MEDKAKFVEKLGQFYHENIEEEVEGLRYITTPTDERVIVHYRSGARKSFSVKSDSKKAIFTDFGRFLTNFEDYDWEI